MKFVPALTAALGAPLQGRTLRAVVRISALIVGAVAVFSVGFHVIMALEGREFSWASSVYWTVVTMTTLGFGDIVFESDLGQLYSIVVLLAGAVLILVLLPFTFIQLVYLPWREAVRHAQAPRELPADLRGHILITGLDPVEDALSRRAEAAGVPCFLLVEDVEAGLTLSDQGHRVMVGQLDDPATWRSARVEDASLVLTARSDERNSNVAFTVREVTDEGLIVVTARSEDAVDVLELAGADHVLQLGRSLGEAFARRILTPDARYSEISRFDDLVIAETSASGTDLVGSTLAELNLRRRFNVSVVGVWDRGTLESAAPNLRVKDSSILLLAGTPDALDAYDETHGRKSGQRDEHELVLIVGGGRVGRATAARLAERDVPFRIIDKLEDRVRHLDPEQVVVGEASDLAVLREAGIDQATAVVITTHDDDTNVFLTLYCRRLRKDAEILCRSRLDRNVSTLHRAGADFVLSYASTGATEVWNLLKDDSTLLLAEGLVIFRVPVPDELAGRRLSDVEIPADTGCSVVAVVAGGHAESRVDGDTELPADADLLLIGDDLAEERFLARYVNENGRGPLRRLIRSLTG